MSYFRAKKIQINIVTNLKITDLLSNIKILKRHYEQ